MKPRNYKGKRDIEANPAPLIIKSTKKPETELEKLMSLVRQTERKRIVETIESAISCEQNRSCKHGYNCHTLRRVVRMIQWEMNNNER